MHLWGLKKLNLLKERDNRWCDLAGTLAILSLTIKWCWDLRLSQEDIKGQANGTRLGQNGFAKCVVLIISFCAYTEVTGFRKKQ